MRPLNRLLISDLKRHWGQGLAICAVLASGFATFVMSSSTIRSLERTREACYRQYRFADAFVQVTRAPNSLANRLAAIPGVARVDTRVVRDVIVDIPEMPEPVSGRLISIPADRGQCLNAIHLLRGRFPDPFASREVVASEMFARAHGWQPGHTVSVVMGGRKQQLSIVGIAMSPEYVYAVQPGQLLADDRRFGVFWMRYEQMAAAFNMEGAFNDAAFTLQPDCSRRDVLFRIDEMTRPWGGRTAFLRDDQDSHRRVADEMHQLHSMAYVSPSIFLAVAAFLFNIMMTRLVHQQQTQIATLRAFGYSSREVGKYYLKLLFVLVVIGSGIGCLIGAGASHWMTNIYIRFFRFPFVQYEFAASSAALAFLICSVASIGGSLSAIRKAMKLPPAVAMRPVAPRPAHESFLERLGLRRFLSPATRLIVRRLEQARLATSLSILGMACGVGVLVLGTFMGDTIDYVMDVQFQRTQRQDVMVTFNETLSAGAVHDLRHLPGVATAEPFRAVPARLAHGTSSRRMSLMGLDNRPELFRVLDDELDQVSLDRPGLAISRKLAEMLNLNAGDDVVIELLDGSQQFRTARVESVFSDFTDPGAYMNRFDLHRLLDEGERISGAFLSVDSRQIPKLYSCLKETPTLAAVTVKSAAIRNFRDTIGANLLPMRIINGIFAFIIAFGVIYNCALITIAERSRDLATLRIMGFSRAEVSKVLLGELAIITLASIPIGLLTGYGFCYLMTLALDTETHRFPLIVERSTFANAALVILIAATISSLIVRRMLDDLDLIGVLKEQER